MFRKYVESSLLKLKKLAAMAFNNWEHPRQGTMDKIIQAMKENGLSTRKALYRSDIILTVAKTSRMVKGPNPVSQAEATRHLRVNMADSRMYEYRRLYMGKKFSILRFQNCNL
jgi:hypothetical protein